MDLHNLQQMINDKNISMFTAYMYVSEIRCITVSLEPL